MPPEPAAVWGSLVGQDDVVALLSAAAAAAQEVVRAGRAGRAGRTGPAARPGGMTHAWLLTGPAGSGRSVAARAFAAALACQQTPPGCGHCPGCRSVLAGTSPDLRVLTPEGLSIGVAEVRGLVREAASAPTTGGWRVVVVEDADRLTEQASNALLKALEEPSDRAVFLLCAPSADDVLPTVRSRCRQAALRLPTADDVAAVLRSDGIDAAIAAFAARAAQGHVGRARRLATDEASRGRRAEVLALPGQLRTVGDCLTAAANLLGAADEEADRLTADRDERETVALRESLGAGATRTTAGSGGRSARGSGAAGRGTAVSVRGSAGALRELETTQKRRATRARRDALDRALVDLAAWYRDVLVRQLGAGVDPVHVDQAESQGRLASRTTPEQTLRRIDAVLACRTALAANVAPLLAVEAMAVALRGG